MTEVQVLQFINGKDVTSNSWFDVTDPGRPSTVVGRAANGSVADVNHAVSSATAAQQAWAATPLADRAAAIREGLARIRDEQPALSQLLMRENGALRLEAELDLARSLELSEDIVRRGLSRLQPRIIENDTDTVTILSKPIGPVAMVVPWNSPMVLSASKVAPALISGNTIIMKPSAEAPLALTSALRLLGTALPPGVINVINSANGIGSTLTSHPDVRKVSYTGSTEVGRHIMAAAAQNIKRISLELGGNDPAVVLEDADLTSAIPLLAKGVFTRAGQICFAVKRIYVARAIFPEFLARFRAHVDTFVCGYGDDATANLGPLVNASQKQQVQRLIDDSTAAGATVEVLGSISPAAEQDGGFYLRPTIVTGLPQSAPLVTEEQFGPVVPILPFDTDAEAIELANDSIYGLASSVWSTDPVRAMSVASSFEAGCTFINSHNVWSLSFDMPFGGVKQSGLGRERTEYGIDEYVEPHAIRMATPTRR